MSWPCAQVSISRAVIDDAGPMSSPYQGSRTPGSALPYPWSRARRAVAYQVISSAGARWRYSAAIWSGKSSPRPASAAASRRNRSGSRIDSSVVSSKYARWETWSAMVQPGAGVGSRHWSAASELSIAPSDADS